MTLGLVRVFKMDLPLPDPNYAGTTINGVRTQLPSIDDDWENLTLPDSNVFAASIIGFASNSLLSTVTYTLESKYGTIQRDASDIQALLDNLIQRFPKTSFPQLPQREWGNQLRSIGETVQEFGSTVVYTGTTFGEKLVFNVATLVGVGEMEIDHDEPGRRFPGDGDGDGDGKLSKGESPTGGESPGGESPTRGGSSETKEPGKTEALVPPPFPAPDDHVSAYEEHMNIMCAGLTSFLCSLASIEHVWSSDLVDTFLGAPPLARVPVRAEHFLLQPLPSVRHQIGRGEEFELAMVVDDDDSWIIWDFYVEDNVDIGFEVSFQAHDQELEDEDEDENEEESSKTEQQQRKEEEKPRAVEEEKEGEEGEEEKEEKEEKKHEEKNRKEEEEEEEEEKEEEGGVVVPYVRYPTESCNATKHVVGRYGPGRSGTVLLRWDNSPSLVRGRVLHRVVEVVDGGMLEAAEAAAEDEERIGRHQREEKQRDQETRRAMEMTGGMMVVGAGGGGGQHSEETLRGMLMKRLESMEDMVASMTAKRDQATALLMMERQTRTETELLLRDTHGRLESLRMEMTQSRSRTSSLQQEFERTKGELSQQTSLAETRNQRVMESERELVKIRREHDSLLDEKRAWSFSKLDLAARADEAELVTSLREQLADAEDTSLRSLHEVEEARSLQRSLQTQVIQCKVQMKTDQDEYSFEKISMKKMLTVERQRTLGLTTKVRGLHAQVSKYKTHKRVLVQELRARRKEQREMSGEKEDLRMRSFDSLRSESTSSTSSSTSIVEEGSKSGSTGSSGDSGGGGSVLPSIRSHVVTVDDDFNSLLILYDMSLSDLKRLNRLFGQNHLPPVGSVLKVTPGSRTMQRVRQQKLSEGSSPGLVVRGWEN